MKLSKEHQTELIKELKERFEKNMNRHKEVDWLKVQERLEANPDKLKILDEMEITGGEPDVVAYHKDTGEYVFYDCAEESPKGRRSYCYDKAAWESRKQHKPANNVIDAAKEIGIELLNEEEYNYLQSLGSFDNKTSSWIKTPSDVRKLGGAIFGDYRFGRVFIYHNGAESYYAARGFRGSVKI